MDDDALARRMDADDAIARNRRAAFREMQRDAWRQFAPAHVELGLLKLHRPAAFVLADLLLEAGERSHRDSACFERTFTDGDEEFLLVVFTERFRGLLKRRIRKLVSVAMQRVRDSSEKAKCELSTTLETTINLPFLAADETGPKHLELQLTRAKLENLVDTLIKKTVEPCRQALTDAGVLPA